MKKMGLCTFIIIILVNTNNVFYEAHFNNRPILIDDLVNSLQKYEEWISNNYIINGTFIEDVGYPFYLSGFSELYRGLCLYKSNAYLNKYNEILSHIIKIQSNWTWSSKEVGAHPHYSTHFAKIFYDAYIYTKNETYLSSFINTTLSLTNFYSGEYIYPSYNANFYAFVILAKALYHNLIPLQYSQFASQLFNYSLTYYNENTHTWFQFTSPTFANGYDGRAAYYQLISLIWFLANEEAIQVTFPTFYEKLLEISKYSIALVEKYLLKSGTYYYTPEAPDYTESASAVMYGFTLIDKYFNTDHSYNIKTSIQTILQRQRDDGAYFKTNNTIVEVWYTDNIPFYCFDFLQLFTKSETGIYFLSVGIPISLLILVIFITNNIYRNKFLIKNRKLNNTNENC